MIKLAKEIPDQLVSAYKAGAQEIRNGNFKLAEKKLLEAFHSLKNLGIRIFWNI